MNDTMTAMAKSIGFNVEKVRKEFPILSKKINGKQLIYFDSAATGHKPKRVIDKLYSFYLEEYGKPNEKHTLGKEATKEMDDARSKVASFIGASKKEVIFTKGCTEGINIVAGGFARGILRKGDIVLITELEHHSNIVPWIMACETTGAELRVIPILPSGELDMKVFEKMLTKKVKIISVSHSSHVLGTVLPIREITKMAHKRDIPVLVDGAQYAPYAKIDVKKLDCDFYTFSGHKMGSPSGIGVLYGKSSWLEKLPPYEGGNDMAKEVRFEEAVFANIPQKFEAGTQPFAQIIAFGELIDFLNEIDMEKSSQYEQELLKYATERLFEIEKVKVIGVAREKEPVISFYLDSMDVKDLEKFLDEKYNIAVRAGELSAQPLMKVLDIPDSQLLRVSLCYYNTFDEIDVLIRAVKRFIKEEDEKIFPSKIF